MEHQHSHPTRSTKEPQSHPPLRAPLHPKTTAGRLAKAEAQRLNNDAERSPPSLRSTATDKHGKPKQSKPRVLPPPGEAFGMDAPSREEAKKKRSRQRRKPMTTQGKAAEATRKTRKAATGEAKAEKPPSIVAMMDMLEAGGAAKQPGENRVVCRATARTRYLKALKAAGAQSSIPVGFRLLDLPVAVRTRIWKLCVVYESFFVRPDSPTGAEQPDLAMTCRQIRTEVLPMYYGINTFAVDVSPEEMSDGHADTVEQLPRQSFTAVEKWASILEESGWFGCIRNWGFSYMPMPFAGRANSTVDEVSLLVSLRLGRATNGSCFAEAVEVHRHAQYVLPATPEYGMCCVRKHPDWLNSAVIRVVELAGRSMVRGERIVQLAKVIMEGIDELVETRCEEVFGSVEDFEYAEGGASRNQQEHQRY